jgi:hypothetical protein
MSSTLADVKSIIPAPFETVNFNYMSQTSNANNYLITCFKVYSLANRSDACTAMVKILNLYFFGI